MHSISAVFSNHVIGVALIGWFVAQGLKIPINYLVNKKWDFSRFHGSGGMPSSHSSMVVATTGIIGVLEGFDTSIFALAVVLSSIVMYDAAGVRRATGTQAAILNNIIKNFLLNGEPITEEKLKELVGHTPLEVLVGAIVGLLCCICYCTFVL